MHKDIIVVGASAGGVEALKELVAALPPDLPAALFVVLHIPAYERSELPNILQRRTRLTVAHPRQEEPFVHGRIYVAPPDRHMVLDGERVLLTKGPRENRVRPAVDTLFRSAAYHHRTRVIGVVLSGTLDDGTAGLWTIKQQGGTAVVQDPADAAFSGMPTSALRYVEPDYVKPLAELPAVLVELTRRAAVLREVKMPKQLEVEVRIGQGEPALEVGVTELGTLTRYTCPECKGVLAQIEEGRLLRFRCHTGHAFSLETFLADVTRSVEDILWSSLRALEEKLLLLQQVASRQSAEDTAAQHELAAQVTAVQAQMDKVREALAAKYDGKLAALKSG